MNVHENAPVEFVVTVVSLAWPTKHAVGSKSTPLNASVAPEFTVNPVPTVVNELPTGPCVGVTVMAGVVTVNDP